MTYKEWEKRLKRLLTPLPKTERISVLDYYRELFSDKTEAGLSEQEITAEFGSPEACAYKILAENSEQSGENPTVNAYMPRPYGVSVGYVIGLFFITVLLILPLASVALGVIVTFGAVSLSGAILSVAGAIYAIVSPFFAGGGALALANVGTGLALGGVGIFLCIGFFLATKYTAIGTYKALRFIYKRR
ncbi:MAG: DUF1700 domain-containing protein [Clostridia bacterium]|nr:DUF1700 domain-containing protein [Clostridia bacterium]